MKNRQLLSLVIIFVTTAPLCSQDLNLFDYWTFYSDAQNSMYKTSCALAFEQIDRRELAISQLITKKDYLARQETVKEKLLRIIGPMPEKTPLNPRITGVITKDDYRVEKVIFESLPNYYVTAALFLPKKLKGKAPAIIYASGHTENGFRSETYQHIIINLVMKGFIVLAFDPVGQGERLQYFVEDEGKSPFGPTTEYSYPGAQCYISGYSPAKYFIWDGIRCVDYLLTRKEVDPKRIGMTGRSGGGTQTAYTAAVDDRILAAAPEAFITSMEYIFKTIGPQDAEQNLFHMIDEGIDHADLLEIRAPRPCLMVTTTRDFFSIQGARETYKEVEHFYEALGSKELINMVEDDDVHSSTRKNREAMYAFFQKYLENPGSSEDVEVSILDEKELWVTETGQLATSLKGETLYSLNKRVVEKQIENLETLRSDSERYLAGIADSAKQWSGFEYPGSYGSSVFSGRFVEKEQIIEKYLVPGSSNYMLPVVLLLPTQKRKNEIILILDEQGLEHAAKNDSLIRSILQKGYSVLLFDVPGIGSLGPGYMRGDSQIDNTSFNQWFAGIITNKSLVGMRVEDIFRILSFVKTDLEEVEVISALAFGATGSELLHAAVFDETIQKVGIIGSFLSFADIALSEKYSPRFIPSTVAGALTEYDLPDLIAGLCPRKVFIIDPVTGHGLSASEREVSDFLTFPIEVYSKQGVKENFKHSMENKNQSTNEKIISWIEQAF
ncbi:MAG: acetylxylan esterase [Bacteroidetes bacterium]|nr:acetylxylan esterase [Bacteroidota bacterium]